jgi:hypothetical protein
MKRGCWTAVELELLRRNYADSRTDDLATALGRTVSQVYQAAQRHGLQKSPEYLKSEAACRLRRGDSVGEESRFQPGAVPWNKGLRGVVGVQPGCVRTHFQPGRRPHTWLPVGSTRVTKDGYLQRKVSDTGRVSKDWQAVHALMWVAAHGPVPAGYVVVFRPGRKTTDEAAISLDGLECVARQELMRRNSCHTRYPPEVARLIQLKGAIALVVNRLEREQQKATPP